MRLLSGEYVYIVKKEVGWVLGGFVPNDLRITMTVCPKEIVWTPNGMVNCDPLREHEGTIEVVPM